MRVVLLGMPASGKGTLGKGLSNHFDLPLISVGDILRQLPTDYEHYDLVQAEMARGRLVDPKIVGSLLENVLSKTEHKQGFILDGWLRQKLDLSIFDPDPNFVIYANISETTARTRIQNRLVCKTCGHTYNLLIKTPVVEGICDIDGSVLVQRDDDNSKTMQERFLIFHEQTVPVIEHYRALGKLVEVDAEPLPEVVLENAIKKLEQMV